MLDDIASPEDRKFWNWAKNRLYIHYPHNQAITAAIEAAKAVPAQKRRNAYIRAYNQTITACLTLHGHSYQQWRKRQKDKKRARWSK